MVMGSSPLAGTPAEPSMLVNIPRLVTAYYARQPDPTLPLLSGIIGGTVVAASRGQDEGYLRVVRAGRQAQLPG